MALARRALARTLASCSRGAIGLQRLRLGQSAGIPVGGRSALRLVQAVRFPTQSELHASAVALQSQQAGGAAAGTSTAAGGSEAAASQDGSSSVTADGEDADTISSSSSDSDGAAGGPAAAAQAKGSSSGAVSSAEGEDKAEDADASEDVDVLHARIKELEGEVEEAKLGRLRALADAETTRRIASKDVEAARNFSIQKFAKQLLDVSDNLQRALDSVPAEHLDAVAGESDSESGPQRSLVLLRTGVDATRQELHRVFKGQGIEEFGAAGDKFDPNLHDAMFMEPVSEGKEPGTVTQLLQSGFRLKDRVLRPAKVAATPDE